MGIDAWGWDAPLHIQAEEAQAPRRAGHLLGGAPGRPALLADRAPASNLRQLPPTGFQVACFPLKIATRQRGAGVASWRSSPTPRPTSRARPREHAAGARGQPLDRNVDEPTADRGAVAVARSKRALSPTQASVSRAAGRGRGRDIVRLNVACGLERFGRRWPIGSKRLEQRAG